METVRRLSLAAADIASELRKEPTPVRVEGNKGKWIRFICCVPNPAPADVPVTYTRERVAPTQEPVTAQPDVNGLVEIPLKSRGNLF